MVSAEAGVRCYKWDVKYEFKSPDCYKKLAITINRKTSGPTILARQGDTVIVEVTNGLVTENLVIHWHRIRQPGTYLYHAHYGMQREAGLYGSIRVLLPDGVAEPFTYDYDRSIILNDWYHASTYEQAAGLSSIPFVWVEEPQSLLIQGKGKFDCSKLATPSSDPTACNTTNPECSPYVMTVVPGKTYRLRISSVTALSALGFQTEGHNMTIVEADGHYVEPIVVQNLFIYSGETYSVLIKIDQEPSRNYWITTNIVGRDATATTPPGLAILNYYPNHPKRVPPTDPPAGPIWNDTAPRLAQSVAIKARQGYVHTPPPKSDRVIVLLNTQNKIDGYTRWSVNNVSFTLPHTPYLTALKENLHHVFDQHPPPDRLHDFATYDIYRVVNNTNATSSNAIYRLKFNSTVDIILQNANTMTVNNSETHPWHLHGHDFWVLGYGTGKFDAENDPKNPPLRFVADNPGVWAFHCHIESHFYMGMGVVFEEGVEKVGKLPSEIMGCGETKAFKRP
ncbi:hypothetical protein EUGRSUZ_I00386 [Eucalyptus grandis]|uniref:L-ascorbate oxidase n=2 Tax=Eucalyptus grandis TaxID=71139 RepID=A0A059AKG3_EUCGR|nr:hypothetical protein EUGRSUZ_I00386 [Eucalyptus grandis]